MTQLVDAEDQSKCKGSWSLLISKSLCKSIFITSAMLIQRRYAYSVLCYAEHLLVVFADYLLSI